VNSNCDTNDAQREWKRIKNDWRCNLSNDTLNLLMRIDIEGPTIADFDPRAVVNRWYISGQARRRPNIAPYGHHH